MQTHPHRTGSADALGNVNAYGGGVWPTQELCEMDRSGIAGFKNVAG